MILTAATTGHAAAHGADPVTVILIGFAVAAGYALSLYLKPIRNCPRCDGTGAKRTSTGRPTGAICRRCRGTGRIRRLGATTVHRFYWSAPQRPAPRTPPRPARPARQHTGHPRP